MTPSSSANVARRHVSHTLGESPSTVNFCTTILIDEQLKGYCQGDEPQAPDIFLRIRVIDRLQRRRFWIGLLRLLLPVFVIGLVAWASAPLLLSVLPRSDLLLRLTGVLGLAGTLTMDGSPIPK